jgi:hypothetical protein
VSVLKTTVTPIDVDVPLDNKVIDGIKLAAKMHLTISGDVEPDLKRLAIWIAGKAGPALLERLGIGVTASTLLRAVAGAMSSTEFNIGVFAAYITVKATMATLQKGDDIQATTKQAMDACYGYKSGFKFAATGVDNNKAGDAAWYGQGINDGNAALQAQATKLQQQFSGFNFQPQEIMNAIREKFASMPEMQNQLGLMIQDNAWPSIKSAYIAAWRKKRGVLEKFFTNVDSDEDKLAVNLGFKGRSDVPPPRDGPVANNAGAAPQ